ncbi:MAG: glycosyltransferase [Patescibacteria group bacterium]|nr:glycosyltransferase [Patescibacteria group bacterium]
MKIALIHDYLIQYGGAERVLESFCELFPRAPIYTLVYNKKILGNVFGKREIRTSFLQKIPFSRSEHHLFPILMPMAVEQFDLSHYDVILSDSASYAKGVITGPKTLHICYCHTPMRYAWDDCHKYTQEFYYPSFIKKMVPLGMNYIRIWDKLAAQRVDYFIANSNLVKKRIGKYYKEQAKVIYPPLFLEHFKRSQEKTSAEYYLMVGRLVPYKKFDLGVKVFNKLGLPLKIVGGGPQYKNLKRMANKNVELLGGLKSSSKELIEVYQNCKALIYPQEEDFGLVPLEAMAMGKPVIAYRKGGAVETVKEGVTGIFFNNQDVSSLEKALKKFEKKEFNPQIIREHAKSFSKERFKQEILDFIEHKVKEFKNN